MPRLAGLTKIEQVAALGVLLAFSKFCHAESSDTPPPTPTSVPAQSPAKITLNLDRIYTFAEILQKAETIAIVEVDTPIDGHIRLKPLEILKAPAEIRNWINPEKVKDAEDLLDQAAKAKPPEKGKPAPEPALTEPPRRTKMPPLLVRTPEGLKLPDVGTQVLVFLWEREEGTLQGAAPRYLLNHPQNLYDDLALVPEVRAELDRKRGQPRRVFLRELDHVLYERLIQKALDAELRKREGGGIAQGLKLRAGRVVVQNFQGLEVSATVRFENQRDFAQAIYVGDGGGFALRLRKEGEKPEESRLYRLGVKQLANKVGADVVSSVSGIVIASDFFGLPENGRADRPVRFTAVDFPELSQLDGEYIANLCFTSEQDGAKVQGLPGRGWVGIVVSEDIKLVFKKAK